MMFFKRCKGRLNEEVLNKLYIAAIFCIIIIKLIIVSSIPIWVRDAGGADEYLMLKEAESLLNGEYLGEYDQLTLVKGIMFPLFLAVIAKVGISYMTAVTILNILSCLVALYTMSKFVSNRAIKLIFFGFIMFLPSTYSTNTTLVYRDSITAALSILVISFFMLMYLNIHKNRVKCAVASLCAGISWLILWNTREDTIWTIPLVGIVMVVSLVGALHCKERKKQKIYYVAIVMLPVVLLSSSIQVISYCNYKNYGIWTTNELNDSNYTEAVTLMTSVKPEEEIEYVTITRETLQRIYEVSPSFASLEEIIEYDYDQCGPIFRAGYNPENGELNEDLITWELRGAAASKGYYETAQTAEEFWGAVADEIQVAIDEGKLETRKIMPSRSMIPWPEGEDSFSRLMKSIGKLYVRSISFDSSYVGLMVTDASVTDECIDRYENITGDASVDNSTYSIALNGWVFPKDASDSCTVAIEDASGNNICSLEFDPSEDLYTGFQDTQGITYESSHNARFFVDSTFDTNQLFLIVRNQDQEIVGSVNLADTNEQMWDTENYEYAIDEIRVDEHKAVNYQLSESRVQRLNKIKRVFRVVNICFALVADLYYLLWTMGIIARLIKKKKVEWNEWLYCSAIFGSALIILAGLGYVDAFMVGTSGYLSAAYGLVTLFNIAVVSIFTNRMCIKLTGKENRNEK